MDRREPQFDEQEIPSTKTEPCPSASPTTTSVDHLARSTDQSPQEQFHPGAAPGAKNRECVLSEPPLHLADSTESMWTFNRHSRVMVQQLQEQNLPPMSSRSSVMFRRLSVEGAGVGIALHGSMSQVFQTPMLLAKRLTTRGPEPRATILHSIDGLVREGEMLLVLGRPGSGCSTLLKALAGMTAEYSTWRGDVRYNGVGVDHFKSQFRGDSLYVSDGTS